ncbi:MAG: thioesterase family protein [Aestuariibacter sp.]
MSGETLLDNQQMASIVMDIFDRRLPYNQFLGFQVDKSDLAQAKIQLPWQDSLMGNPFHKILHGGVTSAILDTVGGLKAMLYAAQEMEPMSPQAFSQRMANIGTIDLRVDYLRPGKGEMFVATADIIRKGNKVAVCRMELHNESGTHIAFGTGTYMMS